MRVCLSLALLQVLLAGRHGEAFTPSFLMKKPTTTTGIVGGARPSSSSSSSATSMLAPKKQEEPEAVDVSIPYDAAARLSYDAWRVKYERGDFDPERYPSFKINYETVTVANVVARKEFREKQAAGDGEESDKPKSFNLNQYADMTEEEYLAMKSGTTAVPAPEPVAAPEPEPEPVAAPEPEPEPVDVSIPYDAAARLEYDAWRTTFGKGDFDGPKYDSVFKTNYETVAVFNVVQARNAREGKPVSELLELGEDADRVAVEVPVAVEEEEKSVVVEPEGDVFNDAFNAVVSQNEASDALDEASAALELEEQALAEKLGLANVEELEIALDAMDGIAEDGGDLDTTESREARIRSAYLEWCKTNDKEVDEARFPTFSANYLTMEKFAADNEREMVLNKYADCTEEEYTAMTSAPDEEVVVADAGDTGGTPDEVGIAGAGDTGGTPDEVGIAGAGDTGGTPDKVGIAGAGDTGGTPDEVGIAGAGDTGGTPDEVGIAEAEDTDGTTDGLVINVEEEPDGTTDGLSIVAEEEPIAKEEPVVVEEPEPEPEVAPVAEEPVVVEEPEPEPEVAPVAEEPVVVEEPEPEVAPVAEEPVVVEEPQPEVVPVAKEEPVVVEEPEPEPEVSPVAKKEPVVVPEPEPVKKGLFGFVRNKGPSIEERVALRDKLAAEKAAFLADRNKNSKKRLEKEFADAQKDAQEAQQAKVKREAEEAAANEKEKKARQAAQDKAAAEQAAEAEAAAIAQSKAVAEKEAAQVAKRKVFEEEARAKALEDARLAKEKQANDLQQKVDAQKAAVAKATGVKAPPAVEEKKEAKKIEFPFGSFAKKPEEEKEDPAVTAAVAEKQKADEAKKAADAVAKKETADKKAAEAKKNAAENAAKKEAAAKKAAADAAAKKEIAAQKAAAAAAAKEEAAAKRAAVSGKKEVSVKKVAVKSEPIQLPDFTSLFGGGSPKKESEPAKKKASAAPKKKVPVPTPAPVAKKSDPFSFFGTPKKVEPTPAPAPVEKKPEPFSFFKKPTPEPEPAPAPVEKPAPFSFFGKKPTPAPEPAPAPVEKPAPFSFFGNNKKTAPTPSPKSTLGKKSAPQPIKRSFGTIALKQPDKKKGAAAKSKTKTVAVAPKDDIPVLSKFKQNPDGSLTGKVSNSKSFRNGTKITTSPVKKGAKAGQVVKTGSGSRYRLQ